MKILRLHYWILAIALTLLQVADAAPALQKKNAQSIDAKNLKLAMLEIARQPHPSKVLKNAKSSKVAKIKIPAAVKLPTNCLRWSKSQILGQSKPFDSIIRKYARQYKLDSNLIRSVITAESCFRVKALSHAGAQGLMQLIPDTAKRFGVSDSYQPEQNIHGGAKYLRFLMDRFDGNLKHVIAGYNAGEGRVEQYKGIPPYKETQQYVKNVLKTFKLLAPPKVIDKRKARAKLKRIKTVYYPRKVGLKPGRHGWRYNRRLAPHLYKK